MYIEVIYSEDEISTWCDSQTLLGSAKSANLHILNPHRNTDRTSVRQVGALTLMLECCFIGCRKSAWWRPSSSNHASTLKL